MDRLIFAFSLLLFTLQENLPVGRAHQKMFLDFSLSVCKLLPQSLHLHEHLSAVVIVLIAVAQSSWNSQRPEDEMLHRASALVFPFCALQALERVDLQLLHLSSELTPGCIAQILTNELYLWPTLWRLRIEISTPSEAPWKEYYQLAHKT